MSSPSIWDRLRQAREAVMVNDRARTLAQSAEVVKANHRMAFDAVGQKYEPEDDVINVGDTQVTHHHHPPKPSVLPGLLKWGLLALGMGSGLGLGGMAIANALRTIKPAPAIKDTDTDTWLDLELVPPARVSQ